MKDIWLISDTHFFHHNIIKYSSRPFSSVSEMNEKLIQNWNSVVKPGDKVYHLGDVYMGATIKEFASFWPRLNGKKRLVVGNHDDVKELAKGSFFEKIMLWRKFPEFNCLLTHVPVHQDSIRGGEINIHGHTHDKGSPKGPYKSVCVELINYTPIHIEEISKEEKIERGWEI